MLNKFDKCLDKAEEIIEQQRIYNIDDWEWTRFFKKDQLDVKSIPQKVCRKIWNLKITCGYIHTYNYLFYDFVHIYINS